MSEESADRTREELLEVPLRVVMQADGAFRLQAPTEKLLTGEESVVVRVRFTPDGHALVAAATKEWRDKHLPAEPPVEVTALVGHGPAAAEMIRNAMPKDVPCFTYVLPGPRPR